MEMQALMQVARALVADGKGLLAMDESNPTIHKRFAKVGIPQTEEARRAYRELIATTPGLNESISGAILYDETMRQKTKAGVPIVEVLTGAGIIPGIKVDAGAKDLAAHPGEKISEGLDGLRERLREYFQMGARFAKWRAVIAIGDSIPSQGCIEANAHALARYAALFRKPVWSRSSSRKCSWTAITRLINAGKRPRKCCETCSISSSISALRWKR